MALRRIRIAEARVRFPVGPPSMEEARQEKLNPYFVTGLVDGEGSFTYWRQKSGEIQPCFELKLNIGDRKLVQRVKDFFDLGDIYFPKATNDVRGNNGRIYKGGPMVIYRVCRIDELLCLMWHFVEYPLCGKKQYAFKIWKEIVVLKKLRENREILITLAEALTRANGGSKQ